MIGALQIELSCVVFIALLNHNISSNKPRLQNGTRHNYLISTLLLGHLYPLLHYIIIYLLSSLLYKVVSCVYDTRLKIFYFYQNRLTTEGLVLGDWNFIFAIKPKLCWNFFLSLHYNYLFKSDDGNLYINYCWYLIENYIWMCTKWV